MRRILLALSLVSLLLAPAALASVGSVTVQDDHPFETEPGQPDAQITRSLTLVIAKVGADNTIELLDPQTEKLTVVKLSDAVPLRAKSKKLFDGRKRLAFDDLEKGQRVRISFRADDGAILSVTVLQVA